MHPLLLPERRRVDSGVDTRLTISVAVTVILLGWLALNVNWAFVAGLNFADLWPYRVALLRGIGMTLLVSVVAIAIGLTLGTVLAILLHMPIGPFRWLVIAYVEVARNTPLIVQLFWIHFALPALTGVTTTAVQSGFIAIAFQASGYLTDIARAGIQAVPRGQYEAAYALGLPTRTKWTAVILPQALRIVIPPLANVSISFFKASSILSVLSVGELMSMGLRVSEANFRPIETLTFCGLVYVVLGTIFSRATHRLEHFTAERGRTPAGGAPTP